MIYHIIDVDFWLEVKEQDYFRTNSLDGGGFIHFSKLHQVEEIAEFQDRDADNTLVLEVDEDKLESKLKYEGDKEEFPHLYGPLNLDAVVSVKGLDQFLS